MNGAYLHLVFDYYTRFRILGMYKRSTSVLLFKSRNLNNLVVCFGPEGAVREHSSSLWG